MRARYLPALLAFGPALGGCAYLGLAPAVVDAVNNSRDRGFVGESFEAAAVEACSARASRYGRMTAGAPERISATMIRVGGTVQDATRERAFTCDFQSNGRIARFRIA
jgi:hypothetical protein